MTDQEYRIAEHLPTSVDSGDIKNMAKVVDAKLRQLNPDILLIYPHIDSLSSELVDYLASQLHVDFYDETLSLEQRRQLVKNSIRWHMKKGTPSVITELLKTVYDNATVEEWYQYGGQPYHFRVTILSEKSPDAEKIAYLTNAIEQTKNVRSWLDTVLFARSLKSDLRFGGVTWLHRETYLADDFRTDAQPRIDLRVGQAQHIHKEEYIYGQLE